MPWSEIEHLLKGNPRDAKMRLAREITTIYHGHEAAERGEQYFVTTIQHKEAPKEVKESVAAQGMALSEILVAEGVVSSKSEFVRLVKEGGVSLDGEKLHDPYYKIAASVLVKVGKLRYLKINLE